MPGNDPWDARTAFDRVMDEIAAASSVREVQHLWLEVRRDFAATRGSPSSRRSSPPSGGSSPVKPRQGI
jgi:hypothetical protein